MADAERKVPWLTGGDRWALAVLSGILVGLLLLHWGLRAGWGATGPEVASGDIVHEHKIDLNHAEWWELMAVNGIGEVKGKAIVAYRQERGLFRSVDDLRNVSGFGTITVSRVKDYLTVGEGTATDGRTH